MQHLPPNWLDLHCIALFVLSRYAGTNESTQLRLFAERLTTASPKCKDRSWPRRPVSDQPLQPFLVMHRIDKPVSTTIELHSRHSNKTAHPSRFNPSRAKPWFIMIQQNEIRRRFVYLNIKCQKQHIAFKVFPFFLAQTLLLKERLLQASRAKPQSQTICLAKHGFVFLWLIYLIVISQ